MIKEINAVFDGDNANDADDASEGSLSNNNHIYPTKGCLFPNKDDQMSKKIKVLMKIFYPEKPDHFGPSDCCKEDMQFIEKKKPRTEEQQPLIRSRVHQHLRSHPI